MEKISFKKLLVLLVSVGLLQGFVSCNSAQKKAAPEEKSAVAEKFIGLQLYSVRDSMKTNVPATVACAAARSTVRELLVWPNP